MPDFKSKQIKKVAIVLGIITTLILLLLYTMVDPASNLFPKCPFYLLTSFKCPGCGSQRALHQVLNLNFSEAIHYNAYLVIIAPLIIGYCILVKVLKDKYPETKIAQSLEIPKWSILISILLWWILRNIFNW